MSRRKKEKDVSVARGMYYYRGRYWSALTWSKLNRPAAIADVPPSGEGRGNVPAAKGDTPKGGSERMGEPVTAVVR